LPHCCTAPPITDNASCCRLQIQQHAVELVQGLTGSPDGIAQLGKLSAKLLPSLFRLVPCPEAVSRPALVALVNLSQVCG
jgi:hypothetical protein